MKLVVISVIPRLKIELVNVDPEMSVKDILSKVCQHSAEVCRWDDYIVSVVSEHGVLQLSPAEFATTKLTDLEQRVHNGTIKLIVAPILEGG
ncbi:MAG: hypothetical protein QW266_01445 [Sulfolobales archaeon]